MNSMKQLREKVAERFPTHELRLTQPILETGSWFLDLFREGDLPPVVIEWRQSLGFGITTPVDGDFGIGVDEVCPDVASAYHRIVRLVLSAGLTMPESPKADKPATLPTTTSAADFRNQVASATRTHPPISGRVVREVRVPLSQLFPLKRLKRTQSSPLAASRQLPISAKSHQPVEE